MFNNKQFKHKEKSLGPTLELKIIDDLISQTSSKTNFQDFLFTIACSLNDFFKPRHISFLLKKSKTNYWFAPLGETHFNQTFKEKTIKFFSQQLLSNKNQIHPIKNPFSNENRAGKQLKNPALDIYLFPMLLENQVIGVITIAFDPQPHISSNAQLLLNCVAKLISNKIAQIRMNRTKLSLKKTIRHTQRIGTLGKVAASIAHDFNNLVTGISGFAQILDRKLEIDSPSKKLLESIVSSGEKAAKLSRLLLKYCRKDSIRPELIDFNKEIVNIIKILHMFLNDNIVNETDISKENCFVRIDPVHITQILVNLASNASDAMPFGGRFFIQTKKYLSTRKKCDFSEKKMPTEYILLSVEDSGHGIEEKYLKKIFKPFFTTKKNGYGTGQGLTTISEIVKQSKGFISVESQVKVGSTFLIYLPLAQMTENNQTFLNDSIPASKNTSQF